MRLRRACLTVSVGWIGSAGAAAYLHEFLESRSTEVISLFSRLASHIIDRSVRRTDLNLRSSTASLPALSKACIRLSLAQPTISVFPPAPELPAPVSGSDSSQDAAFNTRTRP